MSKFIQSLFVTRQLPLPDSIFRIVLCYCMIDFNCGRLVYSKYAEILAAQGCLETAMGYLMAVNDQVRPAVVVLSCTA